MASRGRGASAGRLEHAAGGGYSRTVLTRPLVELLTLAARRDHIPTRCSRCWSWRCSGHCGEDSVWRSSEPSRGSHCISGVTCLDPQAAWLSSGPSPSDHSGGPQLVGLKDRSGGWGAPAAKCDAVRAEVSQLCDFWAGTREMVPRRRVSSQARDTLLRSCSRTEGQRCRNSATSTESRSGNIEVPPAPSLITTPRTSMRCTVSTKPHSTSRAKSSPASSRGGNCASYRHGPSSTPRS